MERRLKKGFNIGMVEGIMTEILTSDKKPKNIFGKLARAMGKKKKEDWNSKVSRASLRKDQIGSSQASLRRSQTSIRRRIQHENEMLLKTLNPDKIVEYNPNLDMYSPTTRVAYAKFKVNTLKKEKEKKLAAEKKTEVQQKAGIANQKLEIEKGESSNKQFQTRTPTPQPPSRTPSPARAPASQPPKSNTGPPKPPASQAPKPPTTQGPKPPGIIPPPPSSAAPRPSGPTPGKIAVPAAFKDQGQSGPQVHAPPRARPQPAGPRPTSPPPSHPAPSAPKEPKVTVTPSPASAPAPSKPSPALPKGPPAPAKSPSPALKPAASPSAAGSRAATPSADDPIAAGKSSVTGQVRTGWL